MDGSKEEAGVAFLLHVCFHLDQEFVRGLLVRGLLARELAGLGLLVHVLLALGHGSAGLPRRGAGQLRNRSFSENGYGDKMMMMMINMHADDDDDVTT